MRVVPWLLVVAWSIAGCGQSSRIGTPGAIFRDVHVGWRQHLVLGDSIPASTARLLSQDGPGQYHIRQGSFGGAENIIVRLTPAGRVAELRFRYKPNTDWQARVRDYEDKLGRPQAVISTADSSLARWVDTSTVFEIVRTSAGVESRLRDRRVFQAQQQ